MSLKTPQVTRFFKATAKATREEQVIDAYMRLLFIEDLARPFGSDGLAHDTLFEFKTDVKLSTAAHRVVAQGCYYLRRLLQGGVDNGTVYPMPARLCCADRNEALVVPASQLLPFLGDAYDWERQPSSPDPKLVEALSALPLDILALTPATLPVLVERLQAPAATLKQQLTAATVPAVFAVWKALFGSSLTPQQAALFFLSDVQALTTVNDSTGAALVTMGETVQRVAVPVAQYRAFWSHYFLPPAARELQRILAMKDQLIAMQSRRLTGEFFTPLVFAAKAREYLVKACPDLVERACWWDMCCGTGNLTLGLPPLPGRLFLSTLEATDVAIVRQSGQNPEALLFQYDFLNQPEEELPPALLKALSENKEWLFLLNPPFAGGTGCTYSTGEDSVGRTGSASTAMNRLMLNEHLGFSARNLYLQFLFRLTVLSERYGLKIGVGMFSKTGYLQTEGFDAFRHYLTRKGFSPVSGFVFPSTAFEGIGGTWPCALTVWRNA